MAKNYMLKGKSEAKTTNIFTGQQVKSSVLHCLKNWQANVISRLGRKKAFSTDGLKFVPL